MPKGETVRINPARFRNFRQSVAFQKDLGVSSKTIGRIESGETILRSTAEKLLESLGLPQEFFLCPDNFDYRSFEELFSRFIFANAEIDPAKDPADAKALDSYMRSAEDDELRLPYDAPAIARSDVRESVRRENLLPSGFFQPLLDVMKKIEMRIPVLGTSAASVATWNNPEFAKELSERGMRWVCEKRNKPIPFMASIGNLLANLAWNPQKYVWKPGKKGNGGTGHFAIDKERMESLRIEPKDLADMPALIIVDATHSLAPAAEAFASYVDLAGRAEIFVTAAHAKSYPLSKNAIEASAAFLRLMSIPEKRVFTEAAKCMPGKKHLLFATLRHDAARVVLSSRFADASDAAIHVAAARSAFGSLTFLGPDESAKKRLWKKIIAEYAAIARAVYCED